MIEALPEDVSIEDIMAELYFRYQVDEGLKQLDAGKGIPHEEVEKRMAKEITQGSVQEHCCKMLVTGCRIS